MFFEEGFDEFVSKPIEMAELERVLRKVLPKSMIRYEEKGYETKRHTDGSNGELSGRLQEETISGHSRMKLLEKAGIHTKSGLQYCLNDTAFYDELLLKFAADADQKLEEIDGFFSQKDWENYCIMVHALKSTARMTGADALSDLAKTLEDAAKKADAEYIGAHHEELLKKYREMVQNIRDILGEEEENGEQKEYLEISDVEFRKRLHEINDSLNTFEAEKAKKLIEQMDGFVYGGEPVAGLLEEAGRDIEDFEIAAAVEKVKALLRSLGDGEA